MGELEGELGARFANMSAGARTYATIKYGRHFCDCGDGEWEGIRIAKCLQGREAIAIFFMGEPLAKVVPGQPRIPTWVSTGSPEKLNVIVLPCYK